VPLCLPLCWLYTACFLSACALPSLAGHVVLCFVWRCAALMVVPVPHHQGIEIALHYLMPDLVFTQLSEHTLYATLACIGACVAAIAASVNLLFLNSRSAGSTLGTYWLKHTLLLNFADRHCSGEQFATSQGWYHDITFRGEGSRVKTTDDSEGEGALVLCTETTRGNC
jgi:hypothetical protein